MLYAVIPAAGRGSRLGMELPKILVPVAENLTVWTVLKRKLLPVVNRIHVVLSPAGLPRFEATLADDPDAARVSTSVQPEPRGMGDAIFGAAGAWRRADDILVIWGDQVHVSPETLARARQVQLSRTGPRCTLPVAALAEPYVEYLFDAAGRLAKLLQTREGERCSPGGWGDVGTFLLSTEGLEALWRDYVGMVSKGAVTGELNFLPFLVHLSGHGWPFEHVLVEDADEARGINTPEDLAFFRRLYRHGAPKSPEPRDIPQEE